jgi:hypothetical protein
MVHDAELQISYREKRIAVIGVGRIILIAKWI